MKGIPNIEPFKKRCEELAQLMAQPNYYDDLREAAKVGREYQKLSELIEHYTALEKLYKDTQDNKVILEDSHAEPELKELAQVEVDESEKKIEDLRRQVLLFMLPPDSSDSRNTIIEIRAGAGGDEASLFAGVLYRMYCRFVERKNWKIEPMSSSPSECGGYREISFLVTGEDVYKTMKYESGVHRVQRIPTTEASGRIHTSTATVAVLPEAEEVDIAIHPDDLEITVSRASGPGGQGVNTTDSAVQIVHKPSGVIVYCADERSQQKNKIKAMTVLRSRLLQAKEEEERAKYAAHRKSQIGSGDRSERIRTYNFPQNRLTDHRIGLTLYSLPAIVDGEIDELISALQEADQAERVQELLSKE
ncbi:peptide chain release factor 1 [Opitutia bacterium SCGC AG-212-L18]|nr:peptide chain release factor 1 [Opitutae bacterium SCGC AG-212-L18]